MLQDECEKYYNVMIGRVLEIRNKITEPKIQGMCQEAADQLQKRKDALISTFKKDEEKIISQLLQPNMLGEICIIPADAGLIDKNWNWIYHGQNRHRTTGDEGADYLPKRSDRKPNFVESKWWNCHHVCV